MYSKANGISFSLSLNKDKITINDKHETPIVDQNEYTILESNLNNILYKQSFNKFPIGELTRVSGSTPTRIMGPAGEKGINANALMTMSPNHLSIEHKRLDDIKMQSDFLILKRSSLIQNHVEMSLDTIIDERVNPAGLLTTKGGIGSIMHEEWETYWQNNKEYHRKNTIWDNNPMEIYISPDVKNVPYNACLIISSNHRFFFVGEHSSVYWKNKFKLNKGLYFVINENYLMYLGNYTGTYGLGTRTRIESYEEKKDISEIWHYRCDLPYIKGLDGRCPITDDLYYDIDPDTGQVIDGKKGTVVTESVTLSFEKKLSTSTQEGAEWAYIYGDGSGVIGEEVSTIYTIKTSGPSTWLFERGDLRPPEELNESYEFGDAFKSCNWIEKIPNFDDYTQLLKETFPERFNEQGHVCQIVTDVIVKHAGLRCYTIDENSDTIETIRLIAKPSTRGILEDGTLEPPLGAEEPGTILDKRFILYTTRRTASTNPLQFDDDGVFGPYSDFLIENLIFSPIFENDIRRTVDVEYIPAEAVS